MLELPQSAGAITTLPSITTPSAVCSAGMMSGQLLSLAVSIGLVSFASVKRTTE